MTITQLHRFVSTHIVGFWTIEELNQFATVAKACKDMVNTKIYPTLLAAFKKEKLLEPFLVSVTDATDAREAVRSIYSQVVDKRLGAGVSSIPTWKNAQALKDIIQKKCSIGSITYNAINASSGGIASLPYTWCFMKDRHTLGKVDLNDNALTIFPSVLFRLPLTELHLRHNQIAHLPPEIGRLKSLIVFDISYNQIPEIPETIGELSHLRDLHLNHNRLTRLPASLSKLENLKYCPMGVNPLARVPPALKRTSIAALNTIEIRQAREESPEETPPSYSADVMKERALDLLSFFHGVAQYPLFAAQQLLCSLKEDIFKQEVKVRAWMRQHPQELASVRFLTLSDVTFAHFPKEIFLLPNLTELDMFRCNLTELPKEIDTLSLLKDLRLSLNFITKLPLSLNNLRNLETLWLRGNPIKSLPFCRYDHLIPAIKRELFEQFPFAFKKDEVSENLPVATKRDTPTPTPPEPVLVEPSLCEKFVSACSNFFCYLFSIFQQIVRYMRS